MEKKVYTKKSEKVIDFLIGFFLIPLSIGIPISWVTRFYKYRLIFSWCIFLLALIFIIYLSIKRRFIKIGLIYFFVVVPLVLAGTCFALIIGLNKLH